MGLTFVFSRRDPRPCLCCWQWWRFSRAWRAPGRVRLPRVQSCVTPSRLGESPPAPAQPSGRLGTALTLSLGTHVAGAIVLALLATGRTQVPSRSESAHVHPPAVVWLQGAGPAAGGRRGGTDGKPGPARSAQTPGTGTMAVPVATRSVPRHAPDPVDPDPSLLIARIQPVEAGLERITGLLQPVSLGEPAAAGPGRGEGAGDRRGPGAGSGDKDYGIGDGPGGSGGAIPPEVIRQVKPQYTNAAVHAKLQGIVTLEAVVLPDGSVGEVTIVQSLDRTFGLDLAAIHAVKQWAFRPATRAGTPVPMLVTIELTFTLR